MDLDFSFFGYSPKPKAQKPNTQARGASQVSSKLALPKHRQLKMPSASFALTVEDDSPSFSGLRPSGCKHMAHENTVVILDESTEPANRIRKTYRHTEETIVLSDSSDDSKGDSTSSSDLCLTVKKPPKVVIYSTSETSSCSHNSFQIAKDSALCHLGKIIVQESSSEIDDEGPISCDATFDNPNVPLLSPEKEQNINKWLNENNWNSDDETDSNYERPLLKEPVKVPIFSCKDDAQSNNSLANGVDALMKELYGSEVWRSAKKTTVPSSSESDDSFDRMFQKYLPTKKNGSGVSDSKPKVPDETHPHVPINRKLSYELDEPETCMPPPKPIVKKKNISQPLVKPSTAKNVVIPKRMVTNTKVAAKLPLQPVAENSGLAVRSFLESLSPLTPIPWCDPKALDFRNNFKTKKEELTKELYNLYNKNIFESKLPADMLIEWNVRLNKTAGYCYNRTSTNGRTGVVVRLSRIEISTKVCNTADRLRDTLIHELCHAATWILSGISNGHGKWWKAWAATAMRRYKELPVIARCHSYKIDTKYTYKCTVCAYSIHRHSKSLDINAKRCGYCRGTFELLVNSTKTPKSGTTPVARTPKAPSGFALYVKENYSAVKKNQNSLKHADVMKLLGQQFSATKISN